MKKSGKSKGFIIAIVAITIGFITLVALTLNHFFFAKEINKMNRNPNKIEEPVDRFIAHAGGSIDGVTYTNSKEAIECSYNKGFRFFEIDINVKVDGKLILGHDENDFIKNLFTDLKPPLTLEKLKKAHKKYNYMTVDDLAEWIRKHPDTYFLLDVKGDAINKYKVILKKNKDVTNQLIPYAYSPEEYEFCKELGFERIMYGDYLTRKDPKVLLPYLQKEQENGTLVGLVLADTVDPRIDALAKGCQLYNIRTYYWTIDDANRAKELMTNKGAYGIITDVLTK